MPRSLNRHMWDGYHVWQRSTPRKFRNKIKRQVIYAAEIICRGNKGSSKRKIVTLMLIKELIRVSGKSSIMSLLDKRGGRLPQRTGWIDQLQPSAPFRRAETTQRKQLTSSKPSLAWWTAMMTLLKTLRKNRRVAKARLSVSSIWLPRSDKVCAQRRPRRTRSPRLTTPPEAAFRRSVTRTGGKALRGRGLRPQAARQMKVLRVLAVWPKSSSLSGSNQSRHQSLTHLITCTRT